jgi:uncharacterized protein YdeI (YjbR/CyaY-like superfamily)
VVADINEAMKWSHPTFCRDGKIVVGMAAFRQHAAIHYWRGQELGFETKAGAMGQLGRVTNLGDLPPELDALIAKAAELSAAPAPRKTKHAPKPVPAMHPEFAAALSNAPKAKAVFDGFPPSAQREYLEWVAEAKQDATRQKRIVTATEWLSDSKRRNWKYENC